MKKIFTKMLYRIYGEEFKSRKLFRIFGWNIYISKVRMTQKARCDDNRKQMRYEAIKAAGFRCHECGGKLPDKMCHVSVHSLLDQTHEITKRFAPGNCIVLCPTCNARYQFLKRNKIWQTSAMKENVCKGIGIVLT